MKLNTLLNGSGLILDMIGVILMFQKIDVGTFIYNREEIQPLNKRKNLKLFIGLAFLFAGFVLQFLSLFF